MSKKAFKSQASSARAFAGSSAVGNDLLGTSLPSRPFGTGSSSALSYVFEPPDLSDVDPNLAVIYKSLQKKDSTTKVKALEDLKAYVSQSKLDVEDQKARDDLVEPWIALYPRTSIDTSQRVRQLSHTFQAQIFVLCGKKIAKYLPQIIGAWISGQYDADRGVSRAASESLKHVFPSEEKLNNLWRVYLSNILEFCRDSITKETTLTLSDERVTSPDEATAKYARVVSAALGVLQYILANLSTSFVEKERSIVDDLLDSKELWEMAVDTELLIRRSMYRLLPAALRYQADRMDKSTLSRYFVALSLKIDQSGCDIDYVHALARLTECSPSVWTEFYNGKKSAVASLVTYLRKANPGMQPTYWSNLESILNTVPRDILVTQQQEPVRSNDGSKSLDASTFPVLDAIEGCIRRHTRPRVYQAPAWYAYLNVMRRTLELSDEARAEPALSKHIQPLILEYVAPLPDLTNWVAATSSNTDIASKAFQLISKHAPRFASDLWSTLSASIVENMQVSQPEQSKDYKNSQDALGAALDRWYALRTQLIASDSSGSLKSVYERSLSRELSVMFDLLKNRNGKPYGVTSGLLSVVYHVQATSEGSNDIQQRICDFLSDNLSALVVSPSSVYLIKLIHRLENRFDAQPLYRTILPTLGELTDETAMMASTQLLSSEFIQPFGEMNALIKLIEKRIQNAIHGNDRSWEVVFTAVENSSLGLTPQRKALASIAAGLRIPNTRKSSLKGLGYFTNQHLRELEDLETDVQSTFGDMSLALLQMLNSSDDELSQMAQNILDKWIEGASEDRLQVLMKATSSAVAADSRSPSLKDLLNVTDRIFAVSRQAGFDLAKISSSSVPNEQQLDRTLENAMSRPLRPGLAVSGTLDVVHLLEPNVDVDNLRHSSLSPKAFNSFAVMLRFACFFAELVKRDDFRDFCAKQTLISALRQVLIINSFVEACAEVEDTNDIRRAGDKASIIQPQLRSSVIASIDVASDEVRDDIRQQLLASAEGSSATSYFSARALSFLNEYDGSVTDDAQVLSDLRRSPHIFRSTQILKGWKEESMLLKICNELSADLTGLSIEQHPSEGMRMMAMFDAVVSKSTTNLGQIPRQRLLNLAKHLLVEFGSMRLSKNVKACIIRVLVPILPLLKDLYDPLWEDLVAALVQTWRSTGQKVDDEALSIATTVAAYHRLIQLIEDLSTNDDLKDALSASSGTFDSLLSSLLLELSQVPDSVPFWQTTKSSLHKLIARLQHQTLETATSLYSVFANPSLSLQQAAYDLLGSKISSCQEEVSMEKALTKDYVARLPEELISVILTAPDFEDIEAATKQGNLPFDVQGYLLGWMLIFRHWDHSSPKVQEDYIKEIEEGSYLPNLLKFILDHLIDGRSQLPNVSKFDVKIYDHSQQLSGTSVPHLFSHIYYLCLQHLPNLVRSWWQDTATRQTQTSLEAWTEKYFFEHIAEKDIGDVAKWARDQESASSDHPMDIRPSFTVQEVVASIPIDDQKMSIAIRLPRTYPLARPVVDTVHRVGVDEKKWRTWNLNSQGVINFSRIGGSAALIDGLSAWQKNVTARLKGQILQPFGNPDNPEFLLASLPVANRQFTRPPRPFAGRAQPRLRYRLMWIIRILSSVTFLTSIVLSIPLAFDVGGRACGLAFSLSLASFYFAYSILRVTTPDRSRYRYILIQLVSWAQWLVLPTLLIWSLNKFSFDSNARSSWVERTFGGKRAEDKSLKEWLLGSDGLLEIATVGSWDHFLRFSTPFFQLCEGFCSLLVIQVAGQITRWLVNRGGRSDSWMISFLVLSASVMSSAVYFLWRVSHFPSVSNVDATLIGIAITCAIFLCAWGIGSGKGNPVESSLLFAYIVLCIYQIFTDYQPSEPIVQTPPPSQASPDFPPFPPIIMASYTTVMQALSVLPSAIHASFSILLAAFSTITPSVLISLAYRLFVLYASTRIIPAIRESGARALSQEASLEDDDGAGQILGLLSWFSPSILITVYTSLLMQHFASTSGAENGDWWVNQGGDVGGNTWRWVNIAGTMALYTFELYLGKEDLDGGVTGHWKDD